MPVKWSELRELVETQMERDPQRATLNQRAISQVEEGLSHLAQMGYLFELAPKGQLAELRAVVDQSRTLSIAEASEIVKPIRAPQTSQFEAQEEIPAAEGDET